MKAYILTENDFELLKKTMENWEADMRAKYTRGQRMSGTESGDTLGHVRYHLVSWMNRVMGDK